MKTQKHLLSLLFVGIFSLFTFPTSLQAQLTVSDSLTTNELLDLLFGAGVTVTNITQTCDTNIAMGYFDGSATGIGIPEGVLMTSGSIYNPVTTFTSDGSTDLGNLGYAPLTTLAGISTFDACIIEFDIVSVCDTLVINYVFGSYEYNEYVNSINDVFAFFVSGPGYMPNTNIALVPGTNTAITINNVNNGNSPHGVPATGPCTNCAYFTDNAGDSTIIGYNAFTTSLLAYAAVMPDSTYHIRMGIADASDGILDSGVFLRREGVCATPMMIQISNQGTATNPIIGPFQVMEGTTSEFKINQALVQDSNRYLTFQVLGTSTQGIDFVNFPDSVLLPAGKSDVTVPITFMNDCDVEGMETLMLVYTDPSISCGGGIYTDTLIFEIQDTAPFEINIGPDQTICSGDSIGIGLLSEPGLTYQWNTSIGLSDSASSDPVFSLINSSSNPITQIYTLFATTANGCMAHDTIEITVRPALESFDLGEAIDLCSGDSVAIGTNAVAGLTYAWSSGLGLSDSTSSQSIFSLESSEVFAATYQLLATDINGCSSQDDLLISVYPEVEVAGDLPESICVGDSLEIPFSYENTTDWTWDFGDGNTESGISNPVHIYTQLGTFAIIYEIANDGCSTTGIDSISVEACATGIADLLPDSQLQIYPNPVTDILTIQFDPEITGSVFLMDLKGRKILQTKTAQHHQIDVRKLPAGLYLIHGTTSQGRFVEKVEIIE